MLTRQDKPKDIETWLGALGAPSADRDYKPGHERVHQLMQAIELQGFVFHKPMLRIRLAGTNGKGSTANFLAAALRANGLKVGLYTSPHIVSFHERIQVDASPVSQASLVELMQMVMPLALDVGTSYFETATVLGLVYFSQQHVDVEILEAGVGARLDATTAVAADVGLLTPVGLDHQDWLGDTLEAIAEDKAYVFQDCNIKISAPQHEVVVPILKKVSEDIQVSLLFKGKLATQGEHQKVNAGLAYAAVDQIERARLLPLGLDQAKQAIEALSVKGRLQQVVCYGHTFVLDAAHNKHAIQALLPTFRSTPSFDVIFLATREDRDLSMCVLELKKHAKHVVVMTGKQPHDYERICDALDIEVQLFKEGRFLVLGSFITLGETLRWIELQK